MSVRKHALKYTAAAIAVAAVIIVSSTLYLNQPTTQRVGGATSAKLVIQLTDPPIVPKGTDSLNLTYSSIALLVGEPAGIGQQTTKTVTVSPSGGSATIDLLKLQNVSQTIALANLSNGSIIYSFTITVTGISIDVNGTKSPVTLATGGSTLTVTLAKPSTIQGTNFALLQLNPVIVNTPSGYQMIPSAVGIIRPAGEGEQNQEQVGSQNVLSNEDQILLQHAQGNITASLTTLSVSGNSTTITVQVQNSGNASVVLNAIGIHGNFTALGHSCGTQSSESESRNQTSDSTQTESNNENHSAESTTSTTTTETTDNTTVTPSTSTSTSPVECEMEHASEVVFVPVNSTATGTSCVALNMVLVNGDISHSEDHGLTLAKGQCVTLTFSGVISFGEAKTVIVPSTSAGQAYGVHVIASNGANLQLSCKLPLTSQSCSVSHQED